MPRPLRAAAAAIVCAAATAAGLLAGCVERAPVGDRVCGRETQRAIPLVRDRALDILFVLDRTMSMADQDETLRANARAFANVLAQIEGGLPDLHVAVISADLGGQGVAGCGAGDGARFLGGQRCGLSGPFLHARTADADYFATFSCLLEAPLSTCPVNQPIAAAVRSLDGSEPANDGFRREGAYLVIVVITDGDDCSLIERGVLAGLTSEDAVDARCSSLGEPPLASVRDSIDWLRPVDPKRLIGTLIAGTPPRLAALRDALPERFTDVDIFGPNWADAFIQLSGWSTPIGNPCFDAAIDLEPTVPGIQAECVGSLVTDAGDVPLPWCREPGASPPCMRAIEDPQMCPTELASIQVDLGDERIAGGAVAEIRCALPCD